MNFGVLRAQINEFEPTLIWTVGMMCKRDPAGHFVE
jgi:hypothetical protein